MRRLPLWSGGILAMALLSACGGGSGGGGDGSAVLLSLPETISSSTASVLIEASVDPPEAAASGQWSLLAGPAATLSASSATSAMLQVPLNGSYEVRLQLTTTSGQLLAASTTVQVEVLASASLGLLIEDEQPDGSITPVVAAELQLWWQGQCAATTQSDASGLASFSGLVEDLDNYHLVLSQSP